MVGVGVVDGGGGASVAATASCGQIQRSRGISNSNSGDMARRLSDNHWASCALPCVFGRPVATMRDLSRLRHPLVSSGARRKKTATQKWNCFVSCSFDDKHWRPHTLGVLRVSCRPPPPPSPLLRRRTVWRCPRNANQIRFGIWINKAFNDLSEDQHQIKCQQKCEFSFKWLLFFSSKLVYRFSSRCF